MEKMQVLKLAPHQREEIKMTLIYQGIMPAIKLYMKHTGCRLDEAKRAVEKVGQEIQPGPA